MKRPEIEQKLGAQMHEIGIQQEVVTGHQKTLQKLQADANKLDQQLKDLDNGGNKTDS